MSPITTTLSTHLTMERMCARYTVYTTFLKKSSYWKKTGIWAIKNRKIVQINIIRSDRLSTDKRKTNVTTRAVFFTVGYRDGTSPFTGNHQTTIYKALKVCRFDCWLLPGEFVLVSWVSTVSWNTSVSFSSSEGANNNICKA